MFSTTHLPQLLTCPLHLLIPPPGPSNGEAFLFDDTEDIPCHNTCRHPENNSYPEKISFITEMNVEALFNEHPFEQWAVLTLNFPIGTTPQKAQRAMKRFGRKLLPKHFIAYSWVMGIESREGRQRIHVHIAVIGHEDLRTGINHPLFNQYRGISAKAKAQKRWMNASEITERKRLVKVITSNKALKKIWAELRKELPAMGCLREFPCEIMPVYKTAQATARYLAKNIRESYANKLPQDGTHLRGSSQNVPRVIGAPDTFNLVTFGARDWRSKVGMAAGSIGIGSLEQMQSEYGSHWRCKMRAVIKWMYEYNRTNGTTPHIDAIRDKMIEVMGEPLSSRDLRTDAEKTWADIQAGVIRLAPMRAAVLARQELKMAS